MIRKNPPFAALAGIATFFLAVQAGAQVPAALGWHQLPNTKLRSVCPANDFGGSNYDFNTHCPAVTTAWNSGALDTKRNRLLVWGGGHGDYSGNEIYALDLGTFKFSRITDPGPPISSGCPEAIAGGAQPNSRHTYDGIAYMANVDRLFTVGGSLATCGGMTDATWTFDFAAAKWQQMKPAGDIPNGVPGIVSAYDPNTGKVFVHDDANLYAYDFPANRYTNLASGTGVDYHMTGVIDPKRRKFILIGGGQQWIIDISGSNYKRAALGSTGGNAIVNESSPGLAYDAAEDRIVAWGGGNTAYALNLDTKAWTPITYASGPGEAIPAGTNGRWEYVPSLNAFVVVNEVDANAYLLRWSSKAASVRLQAPPLRPGRGAGPILSFPGDPVLNSSLRALDLEGRALDARPARARGFGSVRILVP